VAAITPLEASALLFRMIAGDNPTMKIACFHRLVLVAVLAFAALPACSDDAMTKAKEDASADSPVPSDALHVGADVVADARPDNQPDTNVPPDTNLPPDTNVPPDTSVLPDTSVSLSLDTGALADAPAAGQTDASAAIDVGIGRQPDSGTSVDQSTGRQPETGGGPEGGTGLGEAGQAGRFAVVPGAIDLGTVVVGSAVPKPTITVTAVSGFVDLTVRASGADVSIDANTSCYATLSPGATCIVVVNFVAASAGAKSDSIVISTEGAGGQVVSVPITATALSPGNLVIRPTIAAFATAVNVPSSPMVFNVANGGDVATGAPWVTITGNNAADFEITENNCLLPIPPSGCTVSVVFTPTTATPANKSAILTVSDSGATGSTVSASLSGTAYLPPALVIAPSQTDLGTVAVGATSASAGFVVSNAGGTASGILAASMSSAHFIITSDTCTGNVLAKGASCSVSVALKPTTGGVHQGTFSVTDGTVSAAATVTGSALP
jgi:hypothetical protein